MDNSWIGANKMKEHLNKILKGVETRREMAEIDYEGTETRVTAEYYRGMVDAYTSVEHLIDREVERL